MRLMARAITIGTLTLALLSAGCGGMLANLSFDLSQGCLAVDTGLALPQQIQIWAVQEENLHFFGV